MTDVNDSVNTCNWCAEWIWVQDYNWTVNFHCFARKTFALHAATQHAWLHISAYSDYCLYVNGQYVARGPMPTDAAYQSYDTHDVAHLLRTGDNCIAIVAHNYAIGWHGQHKERGGLIVQLDIEAADDHLTVATDASWKVLPATAYRSNSPRMFWSTRFVETFDLNQFPHGWLAHNFDDADWQTPLVYGKHPTHPWHRLLPRDIPLLREVLKPAVSAERGAFTLIGVHAVNFDAIVTGRNALVYAHTAFYSEVDRVLIAHIECDDAFRLHVNGRVAAEQNYDEAFARTRTWRGKDDYDQVHYGIGEVGFKVKVNVLAGWNTMLLAVDQGPGGWGFTFAWRAVEGDQLVALPCQADGATGCWLLAGPVPSTGLNDSLDEVANDIEHVEAPAHMPHNPFDYSVVTDYATLMSCESRTTPTPVPAQETLTLQPGEYCIFDLGVVCVGYPELEIASSGGRPVLDVGYSQILSAHRTITFSGNGRVKYVDRVFVSPGVHRWQPLHRRTGRYIHISCRGDAPVAVRCAGLHHTGYPVEQTGAFHCSDDLLNHIWRTSVYTAELLMQSSYQDCLKREEGTWNTSSFNYASRGAACAFGDYALARSTMRTAKRTQDASGWFDSHGLSGLNEDEISECLLWVVWLRDWYLYSGDRDFIAEMWEVVEDNLRFFAKSLNRHGLLDGRNWHLARTGQSVYLDDVLTYTNKPTIEAYRGRYAAELSGLNILYYAALRAASALAGELGLSECGANYERRAQRVRSALRARLWDAGRQHIADFRKEDCLSEEGHPIIQIAAVYYGVADDDQRDTLLRRLVEDMGLPDEDRPDYPLMTFNYYFYFLDILFRNGHEQLGIDLLRRYYGRWLEVGATTFDEHMRLSDLRGKDALPAEYEVHAYGTSALLHFYTHLLGVQPVSAGFASVRIAPRPGDLSFATGCVPTPHGFVEVAWTVSNGVFDIRVRAPAQVRVSLDLPIGYKTRRVEINGELINSVRKQGGSDE